MDKCIFCESYIIIPAYLQKEYAKIGLDFPAGAKICAIKKEVVNNNDTCNDFKERNFSLEEVV